MGVFFPDLEYVSGNLYLTDIFEIALLSQNSKHLFHNYIRLRYSLPQYIQKLTHINDRFLIENGHSFEGAMCNFVNFLEYEQLLDPTPIEIVAHGGFNSDFPILLTNCLKYNFKKIDVLTKSCFIDSMLTFKNAGWTRPGLDSLCEEINLARNSHSAVTDVYLLKTIYSNHPELPKYRYSYSEISIFTNKKIPLSFISLNTLAMESKSNLDLKTKLIEKLNDKTSLNRAQVEKISIYFFNNRYLLHFLYTK